MEVTRTATVEDLPDDPVGEAAAAAVVEILDGVRVEMVYAPIGSSHPEPRCGPGAASATGPGPRGWEVTLLVRLEGGITPLVADGTPLHAVLAALPGAALRAAQRFRGQSRRPWPLTPSQRRAFRDTVAMEALAGHGVAAPEPTDSLLLAETLEYLIELSGIRVESNDLTHGVLIADIFEDTPRLEFEYPADLRPAKRGPLLFDGIRSVLVVDRKGHARTELQRHRIVGSEIRPTDDRSGHFTDTGWLVAEATRRYGGVGLFLRADRTIWTFIGGRPLMLRRGEHWSAVPGQLSAGVTQIVGGERAAQLCVDTAFIISARQHGAILAIVGDVDAVADMVPEKDRYDLRDRADPLAMRVETRLHHLLDVDPLDATTLARLAELDGATILDREGRLLAYGAIVTSADSQHEGARTAAAKTLSERAEIVLKVSADGDITVFRHGEVVTTLLS